jgi:SAM-dependent methyltransferase
MTAYSNPSAYWETRLRQHFDLTGVGYASLGPRYNAKLYQARLRSLEKVLVAEGRVFAGACVLEIGCGSGFYTEYCVRQGVEEYVGVDLTSVSVATLRQRYPQYRFIQADIGQEEIDMTGEFDVVLASDVLFHIVDDDAFGVAIRNIASYLAKGGLLIASDIFPNTTTQTAPHCRSRSIDDYQAQFSRGGVRIRRVEPIFAILQPPPIVPGLGRLWRLYTAFWRYGWRIARWKLFDRLLPEMLDELDRRFFLPRWGVRAPNSKWLLAVKDHAA